MRDNRCESIAARILLMAIYWLTPRCMFPRRTTMISYRKIMLALIALVVVIGGMGFTARPAYASGCSYYHTVRYGQSLSWIGRYYGVSWVYIAQVNGIVPPRYVVYPGEVLCIPSGGYQPSYYPSYSPSYYPASYSYTPTRTWSFSILSVVQNTSVTVQTYSIPDYVTFNIRIGRQTGGSYDWRDLPNLETGVGGSFQVTFNIPADFSGSTPLVLRMVQNKKNGKSFSEDQWFSNIPGGSGTSGPGYTPSYPPGYTPGYSPGYYPGYHWGIPTIWIASVVRNSTVTFTTNNFPPNLDFEVRMGPMHTQGINGYYVGSFNSGAGGTMTLTFNIPPQLYNHYQIAIRTQNWWTGYYSYNWFYNNTAY